MTNHNTQIYLICGSGGVGKTTVSAALGLKFAEEGLKAIVLTIDPAKRLASSLGLKELTDTPKKIKTGSHGGEMWAMMLDTKRTFDRIVERYAPDPATRERIYNNKIYKHLSQMLAGSQEYMAMERLYEIWQQDAYDVIVVDTPPMQNAVDFLEAPDKLSNMISNSMLHLLLKPSITLGKAGFKFFEKGSQQILKIFDRVVGFAFLQDISEMLIAFQELLGGFNSRAVEVKALLQNPATHFMAVCTTNANSVNETEGFSKKLNELGYHLKKIIVNRVYPGKALSKDKLVHDHKMLAKIFENGEADLLSHNYERHLRLIRRDNKMITRLAEVLERDHVTTVPLFLSDIHDVKGLKLLTEHLAV